MSYVFCAPPPHTHKEKKKHMDQISLSSYKKKMKVYFMCNDGMVFFFL